MIPYIRRQKIIDELEKNDLVYVEDLSRILPEISVSTIRRDLKTLADEGQIVLLRGGAAKLKNGSYDVSIETKKLMNVKEKERIAKHAASLVKDGETIYIDSGTTTSLMVNYLMDRQITVVTSNTQIVNQVGEAVFTCIFIGGEVMKHLGSVVGPLAEMMISNMFFDKAFLGVSGYSEENGINTPDLRECNKKKLVKEKSAQTYVLADHSKEGKNTLCKAFDLDECLIITDQTNELLEKYDHFIIADE